MHRSAGRVPAVRATAAGLTLTAALLSGCGLGGDGASPSKAATGKGGAAGASPAQRHTGPLTKEAWSMLNSTHARIEVKQVERFADRSVLRLYLTNLDDTWDTFSFGISLAGVAFGEIQFNLVDPVGRKLYHPLWDQSGNGDMVGSRTRTVAADPGVRYETVIHYPPLPKDVRTVTLMTPSTAGEFTGVPVVDGTGTTGPIAPVQEQGTDVPPGSTYALPMHTQNGKAPGWVEDLHAIVVGEVKSTTTTRTEQRIGLRADVLFDFDKATLTAKAKAVLDDVAAQTKAEADPAKPPIVITGHTDGKGDPAYNLPLSKQRADAVLKELQTRLGAAYQYTATGKGETRPVAKEGGGDDEQARARNRRVEISYRIKQVSTQTTPGTTQGPISPAIAGGPPAGFRASDGPTVATRTIDRTAWGTTTKRRMDVKPFYRDGAFMVVAFEITNLGPAVLSEIEDFGGSDAGRFGSFSVVDPVNKITYKAVMVGPPDKSDGINIDRLDSRWVVFQNKPNTTNRGFFYVAAPPPDVKSITFDAGPFGRFPNVPIQ